MHPQATELNEALSSCSGGILSMLSRRGKELYFPSEGIVKQTEEAKGKRYNATIGIALDDGKRTYSLGCMGDLLDDRLPQEAFSYAPTGGIKELRERWRRMIHEKNPNLRGPISMPITTCGLTNALAIAGAMFLDEGEGLILADRYWGNYRLLFETINGSKLRTYRMFSDAGLDLESLDEAIGEATSAKVCLLFNFPNNPTGYSPTDAESEKIREILVDHADRGKKIVVFIDDAYFGLAYEDDVCRESLFSRLSSSHPNILPIKIDGASKEDFGWGLRIGFITYGYDNEETLRILEQKTLGMIRGSISNAPRLSQELLLLATASETYAQEKKDRFETLRGRYHAVKAILEEERFQEHFSPLPFNSGYFMSIRLKAANAEDARKILLEAFDTGVVAVGEDCIRIAFSSLNQQEIPIVFENILEACRICSETK